MPTTPAYSEYELTPLGEQLIEAMQPLVLWGYLNQFPHTDERAAAGSAAAGA